MMWELVVAVAVAYVLGSIPFGVLAARVVGSIDPRESGSRNIGFTNSLRVSGKKAGAMTLLGDFGKGVLASVAGRAWLADETSALLVAFAVVVGHVFSCFLSLAGGKGVATALGAVLGLDVVVGLALLVVWGLVVYLFKYSSVGALAAFAVFPGLVAMFSYSNAFIVFACAVSALIIARHRENIQRLISGVEGKIG